MYVATCNMLFKYIRIKDALRLTQVTQRSLGDALGSNDRHCEFVRKLLFHL